VSAPGSCAHPAEEPVRCVVSDLDGTLLRSDGTLSPTTRTALRSLESRAVALVIATARTPRAVRRIVGHESLGIVVCANGAVVWDAQTNAVIRDTCFEGAELASAIDRLRGALPDVGVALLSSETMFLDDGYVRLRGKGAHGAAVVSDIGATTTEHRIAIVSFRHPRLLADELITFAEDVFAGVGTASVAGSTTVDVVPRGVNKAVTVAEVALSMGCHPGASAVFGDMPNDLPLFQWAGRAFAVANAHPLVLAAADEVVPSNDDDGVARTLRVLLKL
jgi:Cof subfamily protein (haloacid dehalogenase superfamily)